MRRLCANLFIFLGVWSLALAQQTLAGTTQPSATNSYAQLLQKIAPNIVTVRIVAKFEVKAEGETQSEESKFTLQGAVVSSDGLIMLSGVLLSSESFKQLVGIQGDEVNFTITPQSFKVIFGQETEEYDASLVAVDSQLAVAFIKVRNLGDRKLTPVEFKETIPTIGSELVTISRLPRGYDYAPYFSTGRVISEVSKPRRALLLEGNITELGLPVYNLSGEAVGVMVSLSHGLDDEETDFGFRSNFGSNDRALFLIPTSALKPIIEQAVQRATEQK
ncbi:MAG: trypsin-like peptidase domain-containing protein [Fimbriimonadales bacterium]